MKSILDFINDICLLFQNYYKNTTHSIFQQYDCSNFRGISLLSVVGKVYGRVLINRIRDKTENVIVEVQGGFRRGRGCTDQIFIVRQICEKYLGKGKDVYFAFLDLEKVYDRVDRDAMWNVLRLCGIGDRLL